MLNKAKKVLIDEKINEPAIGDPKEYIVHFDMRFSWSIILLFMAKCNYL
jgi:hypothetical protein